MDLALVIFGLFVPLFLAPVAIAIWAQRAGPGTGWVRRHVRWLWGFVALCWLVSIVVRLAEAPDAPLATLHLGVATVAVIGSVAALFFHRTQGADPT